MELLVVVGFLLVFVGTPVAIGLKSGANCRREHRGVRPARIVLVCATLTLAAIGPFLLAPALGKLVETDAMLGLAGTLLFVLLVASSLGWSLGYLRCGNLIAAPLGLCLFFGLPVLGALPIQWWRAFPQDGCVFDPVSPAKVQQMRGELAKMRRFPWFRSDEANKTSIVARIEALAPPSSSTMQERLAATHLVLRSDGYVLAEGYSRPGKPFDPKPDIYRYRDEIPLITTRDHWLEYRMEYIGPPYYGFATVFQAWSESRSVGLMISHRVGEDVKSSLHRKELKCTDVGILVPTFKGPSSDAPVSRDYSCPRMPSAEWIAAVSDRVCHTVE